MTDLIISNLIVKLTTSGIQPEVIAITRYNVNYIEVIYEVKSNKVNEVFSFIKKIDLGEGITFTGESSITSYDTNGNALFTFYFEISK